MQEDLFAQHPAAIPSFIRSISDSAIALFPLDVEKVWRVVLPSIADVRAQLARRLTTFEKAISIISSAVHLPVLHSESHRAPDSSDAPDADTFARQSEFHQNSVFVAGD